MFAAKRFSHLAVILGCASRRSVLAKVTALCVLPGSVFAAIDAPDDLERSAYVASPRSITLAWQDNANNETGFEVEWSDDGGLTWAAFGTVGADVVTFSDSLPSDPTLFLFRVRAVNATENSAYSNIISVEGTDPAASDTDGDGMNDAFEAANGLDAYFDDAYEDLDGDRFPNIFEHARSTAVDDEESFPVADFVADGSAAPGGNVFSTIQGALDEVDADFQIVRINGGIYEGSGNVNLTVSASHSVLLMGGTGAATAVIDGGGTSRILTTATNTVLDGLTLRNGSANDGGALQIGGGNALVVNCVFSGNTAVQNGGAIYQTGGNTIVAHTTFLNNAAGNAGIAAYAESGAITVSKSIVWNTGTAAELAASGSGSVQATESVVRGGFSGSGNSSTDPLLRQDGHLQAGSPAIDSGSVLFTTLTDMDGESRPVSTTTDIGADEWLDADTDGMPDWWELDQFGTLDGTGSGDFDADGLTNAQEYGQSSDPKDYYSQGSSQITPTISIVSGTNQTGEPSSFAALPLVVEVSSGSSVLANAPVTFTVSGSAQGQVSGTNNGTGLGSTLNVTTSGSGRAQAYYQFPATYAVSGTIQVTAGSGTNVTQADFTAVSSPIPLSGLKLWLKADAGVTKDGSDKVSAWADQSSEANNASQATSGSQPTWINSVFNGKPVIRFDGTNDFFTLGTSSSLATTNFTYFVVTAFGSTSGDRALLSRDVGPGTTNKWIYWYTGGKIQFHIQPGNQALNSTSFSRVVGQLEVFELIKSSRNYQHLRNGQLYGSSTATVDIPAISSDFRIGQAENNFYLNGDIAEVVIFDRSLTVPERAATESYLSAKYGATFSTDSDGDGMPNSYEVSNGLNTLVDDLMGDADGDGAPNQWEYAQGTEAGNAGDFTADWIVDPAHAGDSPSDNIVATITAAIAGVPVDNGNWAASYKTILVMGGEYAETVTIPNNKRVALIGEKSGQPVRVLGSAVNQPAVVVNGRSSLDSLWVTRPALAQYQNTVTGTGIELYGSAGKQVRIANCVVNAQNGAISNNTNPPTDLVVDHCTIFNNKINGIYSYIATKVVVKASILWNPGATEFTFGSGTSSLAGSIVEGGTHGGTNSDPQLALDGMLKSGSPAIDGDTVTTMALDIHGETRPSGSARDIGADEFVDTDSDGLSDRWEMQYFSDLDEVSSGDPDADGLTNAQEYGFTSNPLNDDSDGDGADDGAEIAAGSDLFRSDTDIDGMPDAYEIANGLNPLVDDLMGDADGDGAPNQWEYAKGTAAGDKNDFTPDWIVDPANAADSPSDNIVGTIAVATGTVPVDNGNWAASYKAILVVGGEYAETVTIPNNKRIALVGEKGGQPVKVIGSAVNQPVVVISGRSSLDSFWVSRPALAQYQNTVTGTGLELYGSAGKQVRIANCVVNAQNGAISNNTNPPTDLVIDHCTIFNNKINGIYSYNATKVVVKASILWNPGSTEFTFGSGTSSLAGSIVEGGSHGGTNSDPQLALDGMLKSGSPAIDGDTVTAMALDIHGETRPSGSARDIGADEFVDSDSDGLSDRWEMQYFSDLDEVSTGNPDADGLTNAQEYGLTSNPSNADSDGDGANDGAEIGAGSDLFRSDTDIDGMPDGYEIATGLNPLSDDTLYDRDGDRVANLWEYHKSTDAGDDADIPVWDWVVDPVNSGTSPTDNIVATIGAAVTAAPVLGTSGTGHSIVYVKSGEYAEKVTLPADKAITVIGEAGAEHARVVGTAANQYVFDVRGKAVIDGMRITRPDSILNGTEMPVTGLWIQVAGGASVRVSNSYVVGHSGGIYIYSGTGIIDHCTVYGNKVINTLGKGIAWRSGGYLKMEGSIVWNTNSPAYIDMDQSTGTAPIVTNSIVRGGQFGAANVDPLLRGDGLLSVGSPAIDGDTGSSTLFSDIHGESRPFGSARDIGADEFVDGDSDGLSDTWEMQYFSDLDEVSSGDPDADGLTNAQEYGFTSNPLNADSDGDGANDGAEAAAGSDLFRTDTDIDGMPDGYELANGLNPLSDDTLYDKDGDRVPNLWEYYKSTEAGDEGEVPPWDWVVDPVNSGTSPTDNIVATIGAAVTAAPVLGTSGTGHSIIYVKNGEYAEKVTLPANKAITMIGEAGQDEARVVGTASNQYVFEVRGKAVIDGMRITRPESVLSGTEMPVTGLWIQVAGGTSVRVANSYVVGHSGGIYIYSGTGIIDHCTVYGNKVIQALGKGIAWRSGGYLTLIGSIVWNTNSPAYMDMDQASGTAPIVANSIIRGGQFGGADVDPLLRADGRLTGGSPAIDADTGSSALMTDVHGESRPAGTALDIGADEWADSDEDGLPDSWEMQWFGDLTHDDSDDDDVPDPDGLSNFLEYVFGWNPLVSDTDEDGVNDLKESLLLTGSPFYPTEWSLDTDGDLLIDGLEMYWETDVDAADSNGDGISDYQSVFLGIDPANLDVDGDGVSNADELAAGSSSFVADTDHDGVDDDEDWYPNDPELWDAPAENPSDSTGPVVSFSQPDGVVVTP